MRLQTYHHALVEDLRRSIAEYHREGYLSDSQYARQLEVLDKLFRAGYGRERLVREFSKQAPKGEKTLRYRDEKRGKSTSLRTVEDIGWLCSLRLGPHGYVLDTVR